MINHIDLEKMIIRTPLIPYNSSNITPNYTIYLKPENLQKFGSYKIRGIASVVKKSDASLLCKGLSAASAGNMGQSIAFVAQQLNIPCYIYVPETTPDVKKESIKKLGANLIELPFDEIWGIVRGDIRPPFDGIFIHPVFCEALLTGYESIANEIIEDLPDLDAIIIPFGVGGLSTAVGRVIHKYNPNIAIYTCEPTTAAPLNASLKLGEPAQVNRIPSFVDAIGTPEVLPAVFELLSPIIRGALAVELNDIKQAMYDLLINNKLLCEGGAACSVAATRLVAEWSHHRKIVCLLTGGNLSKDILQQALI